MNELDDECIGVYYRNLFIFMDLKILKNYFKIYILFEFLIIYLLFIDWFIYCLYVRDYRNGKSKI